MRFIVRHWSRIFFYIEISQITKYSLTDVILPGPSLEDSCVSGSKLCEKHEQKQITNKNSIRRAQSHTSLLLTQDDSIQSFPINKKSKSMTENLNTIRQETPPIIEKSQEIIVENKPVNFFFSFYFKFNFC